MSDQPNDHPDALLSTYVDGSATPAESAAVEAHLAVCAACRAELDLARSARLALTALPELESPGLAGEVERALSRQPPAAAGGVGTRLPGGPERATARARRRWLHGPVLQRVAWGSGVAAAAVLVAVFVVRLGPSGGSDETAGLASPTEASDATRSVTRVSQDYTPESLTALTQSLAGTETEFGQAPLSGGTPTSAATATMPPPSPASSQAAAAAARDLTEDEAVSCLERATGLTEGAEVLRLETATFQGQPAVIGVFRELREGGEEGAVLGMAADPSTCDPLFLTRVAP